MSKYSDERKTQNETVEDERTESETVAYEKTPKTANEDADVANKQTETQEELAALRKEL